MFLCLCGLGAKARPLAHDYIISTRPRVVFALTGWGERLRRGVAWAKEQARSEQGSGSAARSCFLWTPIP